MSKHLKKWIYLLTAFLFAFILVRIYYHLTDDFRLSNMTYKFPFAPSWEVPSLTAEEHLVIQKILSQHYLYIGKGAQCYAFASEDQEYVLKFFKFKHLKPNALIENLPPIPPLKKFKQQCIERKKRKLIGVFNGYDLAFRENRQNSQLIYLHLIPTQHLNLSVTVFDKMGFARNINLDDVVFLLQRKGETLRSHLHALFKNSQFADAKNSIVKILEMYISEYKMGIYDHDHGVMQNTGFIKERPFRLDVGKLRKDDRIKDLTTYKKDLQYVMWKINFWVEKYYPYSEKEFKEFLIKKYEEMIGEPLDFSTIDPKQIKKNLFE